MARGVRRKRQPELVREGKVAAERMKPPPFKQTRVIMRVWIQAWGIVTERVAPELAYSFSFLHNGYGGSLQE
jgi:hypothetical protein